MTLPVDNYGYLDIRRYILQVLNNQEVINNLVGNNIYFKTDDVYKALKGEYQALISISIISDKTDDIYKRNVLAQFEVYAQTLEKAQNITSALRFIFDSRLEDDIFSKVQTIRTMDGLGPQNGFRIDLDIKFTFKDKFVL